MSQDSIAVASSVDGNSSSEGRGLWSSRWVFFLAATGSAGGLGHIWKFPYITGGDGGGGGGGANGEGVCALLARGAGASRHWRWLGTVAVLTGFLILSFYAV